MKEVHQPRIIDHQKILEQSIGHHTGPIVHHYVVIERPSIPKPAAPVATAGEGPHIIKVPRMHTKARIKSAASVVRGMGRKSAGVLRGARASTDRVKQSKRLAKTARGYNAIDEAQKAITTRRIV